jgi:hypothetical protein
MRSILIGFAGVSPKSAVPNLVELFSIIVAKAPLESKDWVLDVLYGVRVCFFVLYLFSSILCCRAILSRLVRVQKPRTL